MQRALGSAPAGPASLLAIAIAALACDAPPAIVVVEPAHGTFTTASSVVVAGAVVAVEPADAALTVDGTPVAIAPDGTFSHTVALDPAAIFRPIELVLTEVPSGFTTMRRVTVIVGESVADGDLSPQSIALRINDSGLDQLEANVADLVALDPSTLVPVGTVVLDDCVVVDPLFGWCLGSAYVSVVNPPASISGFELMMDSMTGFVAGDIAVDDLEVNLDIDGSGLVPSCGLTIRAATTTIIGDYALSPDAANPSAVDVDQQGGVAVSFSSFDDDLSGLCDVPIIGDIVQLFLPNIENVATQGFMDILDDPDGGGPADAPIADALEQALAGVEISGPIGESLGVVLETPLFTVAEDDAGITLGSDGRAVADFGSGGGQCVPPAGAPDLAASLHVPEAFPVFSGTTPGGAPYDVGICISTSAFNQLLKAEIECGLLQQDLTQIDVGFGPVPLTAGVLALLIPEFGIFPPASPLVLHLRPTLAPVLSGEPGPGGELADLRVGQLLVEVRDPTPGVTQPLLQAAVDFRAGIELAFDAGTGQLAPVISPVAPADVTVSILDNLVRTNESVLELSLPTLLAPLLPELAAGLGSFPLPGFLGLSLVGVEVAQEGEFSSVYLDLATPIRLAAAADASVLAGLPATNFGSDPTLPVHSETGSGNDRVALLRFDTTGVALPAGFVTLELSVATLGGGAGARFTVHGLADGDAGEGWLETGISWNDAPAVQGPPPPLVDAARTHGGAPLGGFAIDADDVGQPVPFSSAALRDFVNADGDGRVTLLLTRDDDDGALDTAFASREDGVLPAPTLSLIPPP